MGVDPRGIRQPSSLIVRVVVSPATRVELVAAYDWYNIRQAKLAQRFSSDVDAAIARIGEHPMQYQIIRSDIRRAMLRRFPYSLYFRVLPDLVQVIACLHTSRDPHQWQRRT